MGSVNGSERILHEELVVVGELPGKRGIVLRLARVEPCVLEHANAIVGKKLAQPVGDRADGQRRVLSFRTSEM